MSVAPHHSTLLTFSAAERSPLSIRAKALVFLDPRSQRLQAEVERLAPGTQPLLIRGETGTGKELLARHIHRASGRPGLFVALNCASLSPQHGEAELFGHLPGVHNDSASSRAGWYGSAHGGTLFLDEIGDLPLKLQHKLLRALETREVLRVGDREARAVDVRLVAATSFDLSRAAAVGRFDARLLAYLSDGSLHLPPLRERRGDILALADYFLGMHAQRLDLPLPSLGPEAQQALQRYSWPGNSRELESVVHFALLVSDGRIEPAHLDLPAPAGVAAHIPEK